LMQLRHTHDQLLAGLQDPLDEACLIAQTSPTPDGEVPRPSPTKDPRS
jgi:hypothetical protein